MGPTSAVALNRLLTLSRVTLTGFHCIIIFLFFSYQANRPRDLKLIKYEYDFGKSLVFAFDVMHFHSFLLFLFAGAAMLVRLKF